MRRIYVFAIVMAVIFGVLQADDALAQAPGDQTLDRIVPRGQETKISQHGFWYKANNSLYCTNNGTPAITVTTPPRNGSVRLVPGDIKFANCENEIQGTYILYTPKPGFVGQDEFTYFIEAYRGPSLQTPRDRTLTVRITVQ